MVFQSMGDGHITIICSRDMEDDILSSGCNSLQETEGTPD